MRIRLLLMGLLASQLLSCRTSIQFSIPHEFMKQANRQHVSGARGNKMKMEQFSLTKIRRGIHLSYPGWSRGFTLENLILHEFGLEKKEHVKNEKAKFHYSISNAFGSLDVFGREQQVYRSIEYKVLGKPFGILNSWERLQQFRYIFTTVMHDESAGTGDWELVMSNLYDRRLDTVNSFFTVLRPDESGIATNGKDTLFIKPVSTRQTENDKGKPGKLPFQVLSGYEVSTSEGVVAVLDLIDSNVWFYNDLEAKDKLVLAAIATSIFARRVSNTNW